MCVRLPSLLDNCADCLVGPYDAWILRNKQHIVSWKVGPFKKRAMVLWQNGANCGVVSLCNTDRHHAYDN